MMNIADSITRSSSAKTARLGVTEHLDADAALPKAGWVDRSPQSAYAHVPFCAHRCGYCDFATVAGMDERIDDYLGALEAEIAQRLPGRRPVETIFVGGGTPTYVSPSQLAKLMEILGRWFEPTGSFEFTVESNPNTLGATKVAILADHGVNRVSLGAQSFHERLLVTLERNHDPISVGRAIDLLRPRIDNVSIDLIFGIPGQSLSEWTCDLKRAIDLEPTHISAYGLTYEKGTRLWKQRQLQVIEPAAEELEAEMYEAAIDLLAAAGYEQYEISNFALSERSTPGRWRCRHNLTYWANRGYYGFGAGAAAYVDGVRSLNTRELNAYIDRCRSGRSPITQSEALDPLAGARETAMLHLRRIEGLERDAFLDQTGYSIEAFAGKEIARFVEQGLLIDDGRRIRLSRAGLLLADGILGAMLA